MEIPKWDDEIAERGFIYVALNVSADRMAEQSAKSLREHNPGANITLFTDQNVPEGLFNHVVKIPSRNPDKFPGKPAYPNQGIIAKALNIGRSPYQNTVYLDIDTFVCGSLDPLFEILEKRPGYDIAMAIDEAYVSATTRCPEIPVCVPRFNTGVVAYRKNDRTKEMFGAFLGYFMDSVKDDTANEEGAFAAAIYQTEVRVLTLPPEYNCRFIFPFILRDKAVVLHGRPENDTLPSIRDKINKTVTQRAMYNGQLLATYEAVVGFKKY